MQELSFSAKAQLYKHLLNLTKRTTDEDNLLKKQKKRCEANVATIKTPFVAEMIETQLKENKEKLSEIKKCLTEELSSVALTILSNNIEKATELNESYTEKVTEVKEDLEKNLSFDKELMKETCDIWELGREYEKYQININDYIEWVGIELNRRTTKIDKQINNLNENCTNKILWQCNCVKVLVLQIEFPFVHGGIERAIQNVDKAIKLVRIDVSKYTRIFYETKVKLECLMNKTNTLSKKLEELNKKYCDCNIKEIPPKKLKIQVDIKLHELKNGMDQNEFEKLENFVRKTVALITLAYSFSDIEVNRTCLENLLTKKDKKYALQTMSTLKLIIRLLSCKKQDTTGNDLGKNNALKNGYEKLQKEINNAIEYTKSIIPIIDGYLTLPDEEVILSDWESIAKCAYERFLMQKKIKDIVENMLKFEDDSYVNVLTRDLEKIKFYKNKRESILYEIEQLTIAMEKLDEHCHIQLKFYKMKAEEEKKRCCTLEDELKKKFKIEKFDAPFKVFCFLHKYKKRKPQTKDLSQTMTLILILVHNQIETISEKDFFNVIGFYCFMRRNHNSFLRTLLQLKKDCNDFELCDLESINMYRKKFDKNNKKELICTVDNLLIVLRFCSAYNIVYNKEVFLNCVQTDIKLQILSAYNEIRETLGLLEKKSLFANGAYYLIY